MTVTEIYNAVQALKPSEKQNLLAKLGVTVAVAISKEEKQTEERFINVRVCVECSGTHSVHIFYTSK